MATSFVDELNSIEIKHKVQSFADELEALEKEQALKKNTDREWADTPKEFAAGANTMLSSALGSLDKSKLGDIARSLKGKPTKSDVEFARFYQKEKAEQLAKEYLEAGTIFQQGQEALNEGSQYWLDKRSPKAKQVDEHIEQGAGFVDTVGRYAENPAAIVGHTVRNLPQLIPLLALRNAPVSAQMNLGNVYQSEVGGQQAREQSLQDSKGQNSLNRFNSANESQGLGGAISGLAGMIGLRGDTAMLNLLTGQGTRGLTQKSLKEAGKQLGLNIVEETIDEGGSPLASNIAASNNYDSSRDILKDVGKQAAAGAVVGAGMGSVQASSLAVLGNDRQNNNRQNDIDNLINALNNATQAVADNKAKLDVLNANQGNLTAADIAAKQQLEQDIALNQQVANEYEKQLKEAGALSTLDQNPNNPIVDEPIVDANIDTTQANDELKTMAERGDIPDFKTMTLQYGISPENLANMYSRHKKMAQLKANVTEHIKQGDTQAAQEAMSQAGIKQEEADAILDEAIKINTQPKEKTPLNSLSGLLAKNPNADFVKDVLPFLKKKHKINSTSEALALWNEARKANKSATPNAPQPKQSTTTTQTQNTAIEPVVNNETPPTKVTTPSAVPMEVKATPEPVAEIPPVVNNNSPTKDNTEPLVEHTTTKGKTIKGVVRKGITKEEAKLVDPYTFAKDGGFFIREKYLTPQQENTNTAKEEIKRAAESVAKEVLAEANLPTKSQQGNDGVIEDISGEYQHDQLPDATATVTKTDKGYDVDWGDEVQSFTGKNAAIKAKASLIKEKFNKKKPKQDGDGGVTIEPMPKKPISPTNTTSKTTPSTTGEQIAEAMDKTAQAITEAAHNKVVERVKNGEENWVKADMSKQSTQAEQRVEKETEIKDEPKAYGKNVVSVYLTQGGQDGLVISKNEDKYHYTGKFGAGSGHSHADMLKIVNGIKSSKRGVKLGYGVEFELVQQSEQKAEQPKQDKPIKKSPLKATASKSEFNKAFGVNESKIDEIAKDFERESQNNSELNPQESKQPTKKETPIQGKDIWMEVEFIAGNKSKELFYHDLMADPNKPFNTEAEAIADWKSKTEEQSNSTIEETKQPTKKERLLIKIDDELDAALDDFAAIFKEQGKRLSSGVDPVIMGKVLAIGMKASTLYLAKGAVKFAVWAENIIAALSSKGVPQDAVQPYLKGLYAASKMQVSPEIRQQMDKEDDVYDFDFAILNVGQEEAADSIEKTQTTKKTLTDLFYDHLKKGTLPENNAALRKMVAEFDGKEVDNYRLKEAQEMLEAAMARYSRDVVTSNKNGDASTFNQLVDSYNKQPNLNVRTSTSVENQAYSTPAPLAFVAAKMANIGKSTKVYEPTAGNGMLLITALPENATVNEMESTRFNNLKAQGFNAHQGDALKAIENGVIKPSSQDAIITNPPFGSIKENGKTIKVEVDGYKIGKIDHLIVAEALKAMKPNGTAAIIIGADMVQGGISTDDRIFFNWLYSNYNVVSHFEVDGKLYSRQGASWPVRVIIVHGKQESNNNSPVTGAIARYDNWKDVYDQYIKMVVASNNGGLSVGTRGSDNRVENDTATTQPINGVETTQTGARGRNTTRNNDDVGGVSSRDVSNRPRNGGKQLRDSDNVQRFDERTNVQDNLAVGDNRDTGGATRDNSGVGRGSKPNEHTGKDVAVLSDADNSFQVKYTPASSRKDEGVLIPINMRQPLMDSLLTLEDSVGDIDKYAAKELGYRNVEQLHDALMGLQVDSVASAIYQIKEKNKGIIIADQTGIGKGRQAAAIIRWAILNGHTPVFVTVKPQLFTDMYGDLSDIGSNDVKPFIVNTGESISGKDGQKLHKTKPDAKHRKEIEDIASDGVLPDEYNAVFITYSQINKANNQQRLLSSLSGNAIFILDESHNAGGASATGLFVQDLLKEAKGVVYLSATFAKRPDNMPLYFKTDMGMAVGETSELSAAVIQGGLPLQTVISNSLVKAGQLFRRERSYNGVSIETKVDSQNKLAHEKLSDEATKALRAIVAADKMFHNTYFARLEKAMEEQGQQAKAAGNKAEKSVSHHEFSSVVHNFIRQMLLGLKVDTAANEAIAALKRGEKPLIALENTMGSFLNEYVSANGLKEGDSLGNFGYRNVLSRALYRTRAVTIKDKKGKETRKEVGLDELDSETRAAYNAAQKIIDSLDISIPASPIDWMRNRLEAAGYSVAEITGRNMAIDYSTKTPTVSQVPLSEQNDKVGTTRMFNNGELDAIILNVAGSTGISLHASEKFKDQRKRHMIVAQPAQDINIFMQMLGRIHRTGQVILPKYTILSLDLPTEKRPTAVLNKKMKSLNANTSSNTESATSIVSLDMLNKYGDKIVASYLSENQDVARKIGMEVHGDTSTSDTHDDFAKKATGRFALLPVSEQKRIYDEIEPQYAALISYLDETGQNELEPKTVDFDAELKLEAIAVPATGPSTPFGQEAIYGEYKVKPQGKPMSVDEVKALIVKNIGEGVMPAQHTQKLITDGQLAFDSFINTLNEKYKAAENEEEAGIIQKNIVNQQAVFENTKSFIESHRVGSIWQIDIKGDIYNAVITNVKSTFKKGAHGNPFAQSKILISLAVNGELRSVTVPMTEFSRIEVTKYYGTAQDALKPREGDAGLAKIITGNLLAGYANLVGSDGRVISFTKKDGTTEQGILLPKKFNFKDNVRQDFAIKDANDVFKLLKSGVTDILKTGVASRKGDIRIVHNTNTGGITIYTPKSKSTGGKWFLNKKLIDVVGDFVSSGNMMVVNVPSKKAIDALSIVIEKTPLYVLPSQAEATKELLGYYDGQVNLKSGSNPQDTDNKPDSKSATLESDIPKEKTVTQEQVERYNAIRLAEGDKKAQEVLKSEMDDLGFNSTERMHAWDALKAQSYQEQKDTVATEKTAKKAEKAAKTSIKQIAESIIAKSYLFNQREQQFLNDIKTKRKLTEKQESWLRALAEKAAIEIIGDFEIRKPKYESTDMSFEDYVEDFLDMNVGLMSQKQKEDAYKTYQSWLDGSSKPKFSQSSVIGDRTITQVRDKLIKRFDKRIVELLESKGILKIHQSMKTLPKGVLDMARGTEDAAYYNGVVHLIADNLTDENIIPAFVHDLSGHKGFQEMMSPKAYELIMQQFYRLVAQGNSIAIKAKQRAEKAEKDTARQQDEYIPYLLTEQEKAQLATPQERNAVQRLIDHIVRAVKGWVVRHLSKYDTTYKMSRRVSESLTPADILYMAERMVGEIAVYGGDNNSNRDIRFSQQANQPSLTPLDPVNTRNILDRLLRVFAPKADAMRDSAVLRVRVVKSFADLPLVIQEEAKRQGSNDSDIRGVFHNNIFYAVADNLYSAQEVEQTFFHEVYGHYGVRQLFGKSLNVQLNKLWRIIGGIDGMRKFAKEHGVDLTAYEQGLEKTDYSQEVKNLILMDELLAHIAQVRKPSIKQAFNELMGKIRAWLRQKGFAKLASFNNQDLAHILTQARQAARQSVVLKNNEQAIRYSQSSDYKNDANRQIKEQLAKADKMIAEQGKLLAPNGKPSKLNRYQWAQVRTDNFKKWFGDWENKKENYSVVVDRNDEPLVVRHYTSKQFDVFDISKSDGFWFTDKELFSDEIGASGSSRVIEAFLNIRDPDYNGENYDVESYLNGIEEDGIINTYESEDGIYRDYAVINPTQIKSAISNNGEFSPTNPDIRFSIRLPSTPPERSLPQKSIRTAKNMARFAGESMMNIWTYKIGTKLSIALKHPRYKRVFDLVQAHLNHVSVEAYEAIELAPDLLGKLDTFEDYSKRLKTLIPFSGNFDERIKNIEAVAKVIFDGTLIDKQEFNETQLRTKGLTDDQITFYKQARSAINISLKNAAKAEMTRVLLLANVIGEQVARVVTDRELSMDEHKKELLRLIDDKYQIFKAKRDIAIDKKEKAAFSQKMNDLVDAIKTLNKVAKKANKLIEEGYAPLMRYGDYTSSVYDSKGELVDFRMFESASARDEFVEGLNELNLNMKRFDADKANYDDIAAKKYDGFKVITGTMNNSLFEQFKGITPETLALFADTSNIKQTEAYQEYLKLAVSNNSAFKRLIHRKGMMGYSEDLQRVVASFVMSNARRSAKNIYNKLENDAVNAIPKEQGHLQEDAQKLVNYINNPVEEAQQFRNILFLWNLGLSFMFGLVNLTQPFMVTIPKLSEYTTASNAALRVSAATRLAYSATQKGQAPKGFETEYAQAQREGHLDPQNAFVLAGIERGSTGLGSSYWQSLSHGFGLIAQITESMNRKTVFIASMQIGQELQKTGKLKAQGFDSPYDFAIRIIQETQGIYNKGNRGNFARGPFGTVLMMFKQYPIMMVQLMERMAVNPQYAGERDKYRKALLLLLAMLWGAAGATGLPFARDILDVVETVFAWSGKPVNIEREIQVGLGKEAADWVMNGVNAVSPVDVKGRMGMGDLIPATSLLNPVAMGSIGGAQNKEVMQVLGAGGGLVQKFIDGSSALGRGDYRNAVANLAPRSIESMVKGVEMGVTGIYTDRKGNKVRDVSQWDALAKFFDMNPAINARDSRTRGLEARDVMIQGSMARKFKERALDALANNDMAAMDKVDADVAKWNRDNPRYPVEIKARALYRKLRNANKTWQGRDEPPKGMEWMEQYR